MRGDIEERARTAQRFVLWRSLGLLRWLKLAGPDRHLLAPVAYYRHVQHTREDGERRGPDAIVGHFVSAAERRMASIEKLENLRRDAFYHFALARTKYYDEALRAAINEGFHEVVFLGVGMDTRAFRFRQQIDAAGARVIETDLAPWISRRSRFCRGLIGPQRFVQCAFDLEADDIPEAARRAGLDLETRAFVIAEGVTPYVARRGWEAFLRFFGASAAPGSRLVYDAKLAAARSADADADAPGALFRMPRERARIDARHAAFGLVVRQARMSAEIQATLAPYPAPVFDQDVVIVVEAPPA